MPMSLSDLLMFWRIELLGRDADFSWVKLLRRARRSNSDHYLFWFRFAQYLYAKKHRFFISMAKRINKGLIRRHCVEIMLGAEIGEGFSIIHPMGIVVYRGTRIGKNCILRQNTTIGSVEVDNLPIYIGDNVNIGAHCCIIGSGLRIGSNVKLGAMSFVNQDIPDNCTFVTEKVGRVLNRLS